MFAYNPAVTDRSAEILTSANNQAAAIQLQGMQNFSQSLGNAMQSLGDGYAKAQENKMTSQYLDEMAAFYAQTKGPDGQMMMSQEDLEKFSKAGLGAKQGMIAPRQAAYDQMLKNTYAELAFTQALARSNNSAANQSALRQPASNQVPMAAPSQPATANPFTLGAGVQTRPAFP